MSYTTYDIVDTECAASSFNPFAALPTGTVQDMVHPEGERKLPTVLLLHVLPCKVISTNVTGQMIDLGTHDGTEVVTADIKYSKGLMRFIDALLLPRA